MGDGDRKDRGSFGHWAGVVTGAACNAIFTHELLSRDNRDILVDAIGSVISLHSIYLGMIVAGTLTITACAWPLCDTIYKFIQSRMPGYRFGLLSSYLDELTADEGGNYNHAMRERKAACRARFIEDLKKFGVKSPGVDDHRVWAIWQPIIFGLIHARKLKEARQLDPYKLAEEHP